jgi:hypothetical protein
LASSFLPEEYGFVTQQQPLVEETVYLVLDDVPIAGSDVACELGQPMLALLLV